MAGIVIVVAEQVVVGEEKQSTQPGREVIPPGAARSIAGNTGNPSEMMAKGILRVCAFSRRILHTVRGRTLHLLSSTHRAENEWLNG